MRLNKNSIPLILLFSGIFFYLNPQISVAEGRVNFVLGKVFMQNKGRKRLVKKGMKIPNSASIITGKNGRVSIFNYKSRKLVTINPNTKVSLNKLESSSKSSFFFQKLIKGSLAYRNYQTEAGGLRGALEEGKEDIEWDDGLDSKKIDRTKEWELYKKGHFHEIIRKTKNAKDEDGVFLYSVSLYMQSGVQKENEILEKLILLERKASKKKIKEECQRLIGLIHFEVGRFPESMQYLNKYVQFKNDKEISDIIYYMLVKGNRNLGNQRQEKEFYRKMKKYHSGSKLMGKL